MRHRVGVREKMSEIIDHMALKRFGHVKRLSGEWLSKRAYESMVEGRRDGGRPCARWLDGVRTACNERSLELRDAKVMCMEKSGV